MQEIGKSSIVYTVTMADLVAYNLYYFRHSSAIRRRQRRSLIVVPSGIVAVALAVYFLTPIIPLWFCLVWGLCSTLLTVGPMVYYQKRGYIKRVPKMVQQMYSEDKNPGLLGEHTLEVDEEGFTVATDYQHTCYSWGALVRIETEPGYTYLYTGAINGYVIRHDAITSGNFKAVLEQIGRHYQPDKTLPPRVSSQSHV